MTPLVSEGYLCPPGQEYDTLEWVLAKWLIENKVIKGAPVREHAAVGLVEVYGFTWLCLGRNAIPSERGLFLFAMVETHEVVCFENSCCSK